MEKLSTPLDDNAWEAIINDMDAKGFKVHDSLKRSGSAASKISVHPVRCG